MSDLIPINNPENLRRRMRRRAILRKGKTQIFKRLGRFGITNISRLVLGIGIALLFVFSFWAAVLSITLPNPTNLVGARPTEATKVLDRNGIVLLDIYGEKRRNSIPLADIPDQLQKATIAAEDSNFYAHNGFDMKGILRGVVLKPLTGQGFQGGSTITQQLAKNMFLSSRRTVSRKIQELILAMEIERLYAKDKILEMYLNEIPYGGKVYGILSASETFFAKKPQDLSLAETAILAALPQSPTYYSPYGQHSDDLMARKDWTLKRMFELGYITEKQMAEAQKQEIAFSPRKDSIRAPHFVMYVKELLAAKYGEKMLEEGGLTITTTLDWEKQAAAEEAITKYAEGNKAKYNAGNAAMVSIDPNTGEILAMVGSKDYFDLEEDGNFNVTIAERQPGSSIKPLVYAAAFEKGYSPATMLIDVKTDFGQGYSPNNYDGKFRGAMSIRTALQNSINVPAVKTLLYAGVNNSVDMAHRLGITTLNEPERYGASLVLGGGEITLLDMVSAYGVFATGGLRAKPWSVIKVEDARGRVLEENKASSPKRVIDSEIAYQINDVLSDDQARGAVFGVGGPLSISGRTVAAKTGTTDKFRDGWTIGYTPDLVAGVWSGNNDNESMTAASGLVAAPIWNTYMRKALANIPDKPFIMPSGIREIDVDELSGLLPSGDTPSTKKEIFAPNNVPTETDNVHKKVKVMKIAPDKLAPANAPIDLVEEKVFTVLHSERPDNRNWEDPVIKWAKDNGYNNIPTEIYTGPLDGSAVPSITITNPSEGFKVTGPFEVEAQVGDPMTAKKVEFFYDGTLMGQASAQPFRYMLTPPKLDGSSHEVKVRLTKTDNSTAEAKLSIST
ncbi:penicillin-binding protein [Patescibacteria group bacterium]|nr:penicillin-binding protein [Patescibacteria group bacterium]